MASKAHYWFKSNGDFAECVNFVYWWNFSDGGSAINGATPSIFLVPTTSEDKGPTKIFQKIGPRSSFCGLTFSFLSAC